jgi:hypothetical protein
VKLKIKLIYRIADMQGLMWIIKFVMNSSSHKEQLVMKVREREREREMDH